jgi:FAD:protein FMN transferase
VRPMLGTFVEMRVEGLRERDALIAIDAAFAEVATIHRLMSFHELDSNLSCVHAAKVGTVVAVDPRTFEVIAFAKHVAAISDGCFDPTIAAHQVYCGALPRPQSPFDPDLNATWSDIELLDGDHIRLQKPLWIDLGGIAKGYAVDRAIAILQSADATQICVNAGGDLRIVGERSETVQLRNANGTTGYHAVEIGDAALASSVDPTSLRSASVVARECIIADALTKVVLYGNADIAQKTLAHFGAQACIGNASDERRLLDRAA